ncbi:MAG TPA: Rieske 2Fe-2S domain-containing protein [Pseudonocardiaceae bacterium]|nr:Rieske 2Fe-2S domain-containing protein [Pseudonocardiaceae bacterium]
MRGVRRFVEDLLRQHPTRPLDTGPGEDAELRTAITLRAARPGSGEPGEDFVAALHQRLAEGIDNEAAPKPPGRRRFVQAASIAAASAALGAGLTRVLSTESSTPQQVAGPPAGSPTLEPAVGQWRMVAASTDLPEGGVRSFDLGSVVGFVRRSAGHVFAVSGVCTHLGCRLLLDAPAERLDCPCHNASFAVTGQVLHHTLPIALSPLPKLEARELDGIVQVYAPPPEGA